MKIVIELPEEVYEEIMIHNRELRESGKSAYYLEGLIQNGTPLPKGHGALKDIDAIIAEHAMTKWDWNDYVDVDDLRDFPTIIEADKKGE